MNFIDGKKISEEIAEKLKNSFSILNELRIKKKEKKITLGVFVVGNDPVINSFVKIKKKYAEKINVEFNEYRYDNSIEQDDFINDFLDKQKQVDGVIIQLPLPKKFNTEYILSKIDRKKDVDLLNEKNILSFKKGELNNIYPPVTGSIIKILKYSNFNFRNKKIVIIGNGKLVGKPFSDYLELINLKKNIDYFIIDRKITKDIKKKLLKEADLIISGVGISNFVNVNDIKDNVFLIDAGTSTTNKKLVGDISLECAKKTKYFSKTPGGVGPVTVAVLYENLFYLVTNDVNKK